jgi:hypothetical protein
MAKFGKKNKVSENLEDYNICILGESGIGKTTLMVQTCQKLFGEDGYMILNMGKEDGIDCIDGASYEDVPNYKIFDAITRDIIANKDTDYPDLKVLVSDTLDQLFELVEPEAIRRWNVENQGKKDFIPSKTLNQSWGGFGRGEDKVLEIILNRMWELKKVGVAFWSCGHVKTREILDPLTGQTYTSLSTNMMQKYFNGIKTKMHVVGMACIDREIIKESTGRQNVVTKKDITKNKVVAESRKIIFRDDDYGVDSKSRFANIIDQIPLDTDEFIKALKDAIKAAKNNPISKKSVKSTPKSQPKEEVVEDESDTQIEDIDEIDDEIPFTEEDTTSQYPNNLSEVIRVEFKKCKDVNLKAKVREVIKPYGKLADVDEDGLKTIYDILKLKE